MRSKFLFLAVVFCYFHVTATNPVPEKLKKEFKKGFVENKGQILDQNKEQNSNVKFLLNQTGINIQLTKNGFSYDTYIETSFHRIDIELVNCNQNPQIAATDELPGYINYYLPSAPEKGITNIHSYKKVVYKNIYSNIDIEFLLNPALNNSFEYQFVLHPGSNINDIKLKYKGANKISLEKDKIRISVVHGSFTEQIPKSFVVENGMQVVAKYTLLEKNTFGFSVPQKKISLIGKTLIIDPYPILSWSTYYGGNSDEVPYSVATDPGGNVIMVGYTQSTVNIATAGAYQTTLSNPNMDGFIAKFNSSGIIQWATYYGGNGDIQITGVATDASSNIFICGGTAASTGVSTPGSFKPTISGIDGFLVKFNSSGARQWGTYFGGGSFDRLEDVATDGSGDVYIVGLTSTPFGIATFSSYQTSFGGGSYDAIVAKFSTAGSQYWASYYGGNGDDYGYAVTNILGGVYIGGSTASTNSIASVSAQQTAYGGGSTDGFIAELSNNGQFRSFGSYYGGTGNETVEDITGDASGNSIMIGTTSSTANIASPGSFQTVCNGGQDAFVAKFGGPFRTWGTYFGGNIGESGIGVVCDASNNIYATGYTQSSGTIMATPGAYQQATGCSSNIYLLKLNSGGSRLYSTLYGGQGGQSPIGLAISSGSVFIGGVTGPTSTVIITPGSYQTTYGGGVRDCILAMFTETATPAPSFTISGPSTVCPSSTYTYNATYFNNGGYNWQWSFPWDSQSTTSGTVITTTYPVGTSGILTVSPACDFGYALTITITAVPNVGGIGSVTGNTLVCFGSSNVYSIAPVTDATSYNWAFPSGWSGSSSTNSINAMAGSSGNLTVTASNYCGTSSPKTLSITVDKPLLALTPVPVSCNGSCDGSLTFTASGGMSPYTYTPATATSLCAGIYTISATDNMGCKTVSTSVITQPSPLNATAVNISSVTCFGLCNGSFSINASGGTSGYTYSPSITSSSLCSGVYNFTVTDANSCIKISSVSIVQPSILNSSIAASSSAICSGNSSTLTTNSSGGTGPVTYSWSNGSTTQTTIINPTVTTNYSVSITDANGCNSISQNTVTVNPLPTVSISATNSIICPGQSSTLTANSTWTSAITYSWSTASSNQSITVTPTSSSVYSVTITDGNGCSSLTQQNITVNPTPTANAGSSQTITCASLTVNLNGWGVATFTWSGPGIISGGNTSGPTVNSAGTYSLDGSSGSGCASNTATVSVVTNTATPPIVMNVNPNPICSGSSATITASGAGSYTWSTGAFTSSITVSPTTLTFYSVTGMSAINGCTNSAGQVLSVNPLPPVSASTSSVVVCSGNNSCLYAAGALSYVWSGPCGFTSNTQNPCFPFASACGCTYSVTGTDGNGCVNTATVCLNISPDPTVTATTSNTLICAGQTSTLTAGGALTYSWSTSSTNSTTAVSPTTTTNYSVVGTDANGCTNSVSITQSVSPCTNVSSLSSQQNTIQIFPNPFNDKINIEMYIPLDLSFQIFNSLGAIIYSGRIEKGKAEIDLRDQAAGIYFIKAGSVTKKIIKQ